MWRDVKFYGVIGSSYALKRACKNVLDSTFFLFDIFTENTEIKKIIYIIKARESGALEMKQYKNGVLLSTEKNPIFKLFELTSYCNVFADFIFTELKHNCTFYNG